MSLLVVTPRQPYQTMVLPEGSSHHKQYSMQVKVVAAIVRRAERYGRLEEVLVQAVLELGGNGPIENLPDLLGDAGPAKVAAREARSFDG